MSKTETPTNIVAALSKLQTAMKQPSKNAVNPHFKNKYADLGACMDAVKPHLDSLGLAISQATQVGEHGLVLQTVLHHVSGEKIEGTYPINPTKADPQGYGSAMTYARRYALCALLGIVADDDDDGNAASQPPKVKEPTPEQKARAAADKYIERIDLSKTVQEADAVVADMNKGKMAVLFPEYYAEVIEEHKAKVQMLELKAAKESK